MSSRGSESPRKQNPGKMGLRIIIVLSATITMISTFTEAQKGLGSLQICWPWRGCIKPDVVHDQRGWHRGCQGRLLCPPVGPPVVGVTDNFEIGDFGGPISGGIKTPDVEVSAVGVSAPIIGGTTLGLGGAPPSHAFGGTASVVDSSTSGRPITWDNMRGICEGIADLPHSYGLSPQLCSKFLRHMESPFQPYPCACGPRMWEKCGAVPARTKRCYVQVPRGD